MNGRFTQLGRQLRKLRHIIGSSPAAEPVTTLRRATQLACDLACEAAAVKDAQAGFRDLAARGVLEANLAGRLGEYATYVAKAGPPRDEAFREGSLVIGRDLDRLLRSLEAGAPAPEIPFETFILRVTDEAAKPDSSAAVTISGRVLEIDVRGGRAVIFVDERAIAMTLDGTAVPSLPLAAAPQSRAETERDPSGATRITWSDDKLSIDLAADFASAQISLGR